MSFIPHDLFPQILLHLPVKSLVRFRCVSKSWHALIVDPDFIHSHLTHHQNASNNVNNDQIMVLHGDFSSNIDSVVRYNKDFKVKTTLGILETDKLPVYNLKNLLRTCYNGYTKWDVTGSIHGLIMLKNYNRTKLMLWNPSIRKARVLPPMPPILEKYYVYDIGLGFDPSIKDYKYVTLVLKENVVHSFLVYTLGANSWKQNLVSERCPKAIPGMSFGSTESVCFRGVIYFIIGSSIKPDVVASYDLRSEEFSLGNLPEIEDRDYTKSLTLANDGSSLALVYLCRASGKGLIWSGQGGLRADHITWIKVHTFNYQRRGFYVIDFLYLKNSDEILSIWESWKKPEICVVSLNLKTHKEKVLIERGKKKYLYYAYLYMESLVLVDE